MKISIRMDDITSDMNWENFYFFQELFEKVGVTPLLGIVPDNKDTDLMKDSPRTDFYDRIKKLQDEGYCVAMHGCNHLYRTNKGGLFPLNKFSEFAGVAYEEQKTKLELGKSILAENGIATDIFMAPAHSYDKNTLRALLELGFTKLTDGFGKLPYKYNGMTFYPISFRLSSSLKKKYGYTTMVVHANTISEADKEYYTKLFEEHGRDMISYKDYLNVEPVSRSFCGRQKEWILAKLKWLLVKLRG